MDVKRKVVLGLVLLMAIFPLACGGGGGGGGGGSTGPATFTGVFKDSNVGGLDYSTSSGLSGVTDPLGQYTYAAGDSVTFSIGGVTIGTIAAQGVVTPVDLVAGGSSSSNQVQNMVRFLMMLDQDADPNNGITISPAVQAVADTWAPLDFSVDEAAFDLAIAGIVSDCDNADNTTRPVPSASDAQSHIEDTLLCTYAGVFSGTFGGTTSGTFGVILDAQSGFVEGTAYVPILGDTTDVSGTQSISFDQNRSFISGIADIGASWQGQLSSPDDMSGTWQDAGSESGTFSGSRVGSDAGAVYRYTGMAYQPAPYQQDIGALIAMDVDSVGDFTGIVYNLEDNSQTTFSGTIQGGTLTGTGADGTMVTGTYDAVNLTFNGTWSHPTNGTGVIDGCGCRLN